MNNGHIHAFLRAFSKELEEENAAIFAAAGFSRKSGFVDWKMLLKSVGNSLSLDIEREHNLITMAQYYCNESGGSRAGLNRVLLEQFTRDAELTSNHQILARLPITTFWRTNYDKLIEMALLEAGKRPVTKYTVEQLALRDRREDAVVYKMHGDIDHPGGVVLTKDDYERYYLTHRPFITALSSDLVNNTFLFIGFSLTDPNLDYVFSRIRATYDKNMRVHYCFMKAIDEREFVDNETLRYRSRQQALFIKDMARYNIQAILLENYEQINDVFAQLEKIHKSKSVLISGAAHEWGDWSTERARSFNRGLSKTFIDKGLRVVCGFGAGVGSSVISGALESIYTKNRERIEDQLVLRPFPREPASGEAWSVLARRYREDMADYAGAAVFLFGNKIQDGQVVLSDGIAEEFEISKQKGLTLIPVGATGFMARYLWEKVMADFDRHYPLRTSDFKQLFDILGKPEAEPSELIDAVVRIVVLAQELRIA